MLAPALPEPEDWPAPAELEPAAPDGLLEPLDPLEPLELEPLAPPLPGRLAPAEPVVPAGRKTHSVLLRGSAVPPVAEFAPLKTLPR